MTINELCLFLIALGTVVCFGPMVVVSLFERCDRRRRPDDSRRE